MTVCDAAGWISITRNPWTPRPTRFSEGNTGAGQLDQVAGRTGENAFQIAEAVQPSSQAVIAGQDVPEDVDNVIRATADIRALVTYALGQISAMADDFAGLIEPQGLPANWPR
jgi:hypothetical protein